MGTTVENKTEQKQLPDWVAALVEEAYARGVADGREEMRAAAQGVVAIAGRDLGRIRLLPAGKAKNGMIAADYEEQENIMSAEYCECGGEMQIDEGVSVCLACGWWPGRPDQPPGEVINGVRCNRKGEPMPMIPEAGEHTCKGCKQASPPDCEPMVIWCGYFEKLQSSIVPRVRCPGYSGS